MSFHIPSTRCASHKIRQKFWTMDPDCKRAVIPQLIWNDGHAEWSRWYFFKNYWDEHIGYRYGNFK